MSKPFSIIVTAPWTCREAHEALQRLIAEAMPAGAVHTMVLMGAAAPLAAHKPSSLMSPQPPRLQRQPPQQPQPQRPPPPPSQALHTPAAACADQQNSVTASQDIQFLDSLAREYLELARMLEFELLVCGRAAREYGISEENILPGAAFTGYMELLAMMNSKEQKVIVW